MQGSGFRVQGSGFRVQGSRFKVHGADRRVRAHAGHSLLLEIYCRIQLGLDSGPGLRIQGDNIYDIRGWGIGRGTCAVSCQARTMAGSEAYLLNV